MNSLEEIKKKITEYDNNPNYDALEKIAKNLQLVMHQRDAEFVACEDNEEVERIVKNFCENKLEANSEIARQAVNHVCQIMKNEEMKNRIVFYYLVAKEIGCLDRI